LVGVDLVNEVAAGVIDPETGVPIGERLRAKMRIDALEPDAKEHVKAQAKIAADPDKDFPIDALGSARWCRRGAEMRIGM
jgi:N-acetylated-alpha-linked acidic dipeptidase